MSVGDVDEVMRIRGVKLEPPFPVLIRVIRKVVFLTRVEPQEQCGTHALNMLICFLPGEFRYAPECLDSDVLVRHLERAIQPDQIDCVDIRDRLRVLDFAFSDPPNDPTFGGQDGKLRIVNGACGI